MSESTPEYESTPENTEQPEQPDTREPEQPEPVQPADADDGHMAQVVELHSERGSLTLRPNQKALDETQKAALVAIGIDVAKDPQVVPHIRAFVHMCQVKGLDPWAREAYLIGRGNGEKRKYTMQTGIDGYRKMAASTGRFIRVKDVLWTGAEDDDQSYYRDDRGVMRRVWWDQWPASRGYPGAAKVVIEHYDDAGSVVETEAVADWGMYAPFVDKWEWHPTQRGKKVYPKNPDGSAIQELTDMWKKGYAHMLAKCAEALAYRKAFPARMSGIYTHEEMHRADQIERDREADDQRKARQKAYLEATSAPSAPLPARESSDPVPAGETVGEVIQQAQQAAQEAPDAGQDAPQPGQAATDPGQRLAWLRTELAWQAEVLGHGVAALTTRQVRALRKNVEDFTDAELLPVVAGLRPVVVTRLREVGRGDEADTYAALAPEDVVDLAEFMAIDGEVVEDDPAADPALDADPEQPHRYVDDDGVCAVCGGMAGFGDDPLHPASLTD